MSNSAVPAVASDESPSDAQLLSAMSLGDASLPARGSARRGIACARSGGEAEPRHVFGDSVPKCLGHDSIDRSPTRSVVVSSATRRRSALRIITIICPLMNRRFPTGSWT